MPRAIEKRTHRSKHGTQVRTAEAQHKATAPQMFAESQFGLDLLRARWDISFFARRFLGFEPHIGQERLWSGVLMRDSTGWRPRYLDISCVAGNRSGKTLALAVLILHSTIFKLGMEPPNPTSERAVKRWSNAPYEWYHFAIAQETSELAYIEIVRLLSGIHEAQQNGCPLTDALGKEVADWSRKYRGEYLWLKVHPVLGGGEIHFRTTGEKAIGSLGKDMHGVSFDEAGFEPHFDFVINEVLHLRRLSTGGQLILIGTATEGITAFADKWEEGNSEAPDRKRDSFSVRISTRDNIGYGIDQSMFDRIVASLPPNLIPQNIDGHFIEGRLNFFPAQSVDRAFVKGEHDDLCVVSCPVVHGLPEQQQAQRGHRYVQGVDPAVTNDSMWSIVLDSTLEGLAVGVSAARIKGRTTGPAIAALASNQHRSFDVPGSGCITAIDATSMGGKIFRDLLTITPVHSIEFGGTRGKKLKLLNDLRSMLDRNQMRFPRSGPWLELRRQLLGYKLIDKNLETDAVMALAVAVAMVKRGGAGAGAVVGMPFDYFQAGAGGVLSQPAGPILQQGGPRRVASYTSLADMQNKTGR